MTAGIGTWWFRWNVPVKLVSPAGTGTATVMDTIFRTIGGDIGLSNADVFLARCVSPVVVHSIRLCYGPLVPNGTTFDHVPLTALDVTFAYCREALRDKK
jgi:hypothetical protein